MPGLWPVPVSRQFHSRDPPGKSFASLYGSALPSISSRPHETWLIRGERFFSVTTTKSPAKGRAVVLEAVCIARYLVRVKLTFLGTLGEIEARTRRHRMHSSLLVSYRGAKVMMDCGLDWLGKFERLNPDAIVLTHAHPDHSWGLRNGAPCPVFAPEKTWQTLTDCRVEDRHLIKERTPTKICGITFEAFP